MRILLRLETVGDRIYTQKCQQIIPDVNFTCDGLITKRILGATWNNGDDLYSELQVWTETGNNWK